MASTLSSTVITPSSSVVARSVRSGVEPTIIPNGTGAFTCYVGLRRVQLSSASVQTARHERVRKCQGVRAKNSEPSFLQRIGTTLQKANKKPEPEPEPEPKGTGWFRSKPSGTQKVQRGTTLKKGTVIQKAGTAKSSTQRFASLAQTFVQRAKPTDPKTVFVSGATGQTGVRVVKELLVAGFNVRAGVPNAEEADKLIVFALQYEVRPWLCKMRKIWMLLARLLVSVTNLCAANVPLTPSNHCTIASSLQDEQEEKSAGHMAAPPGG
jgi:hypothetical protein